MFILWGKFAQVADLAYLGTYLGRISRRFSPHAFGELQNKGKFISRSKHCVIETAHPSPLSVTKFLGCRCFSKAREEMTWRLQGDYREIAGRLQGDHGAPRRCASHSASKFALRGVEIHLRLHPGRDRSVTLSGTALPVQANNYLRQSGAAEIDWAALPAAGS